MGGYRFKEGEREFIIEARKKGILNKEIIKQCEKKFGIRRTPSAISTLISKEKDNPKPCLVKPIEAKLQIIQGYEKSSLRKALEYFDENILKKAYTQRDNLIYDSLKSQADYLHSLSKDISLKEQLRDLSLDEIVRKLTDLASSGDLAQFISSPKKTKQPEREVNILASELKNRYECSKLILPVYLKTANSPQTEKADSVIHSASLYVMLKEIGISKAPNMPFQEAYHNLTSYNFSHDIESLDLQKIGNRINELVGRDYSSFKIEIIKDSKK